MKRSLARAAGVALCVSAFVVGGARGQTTSPSTQPFTPQPILQGGIVMPLWPAGSKYLNSAKVGEAEVWNMSRDVGARVNSIVGIHNPSIEVHRVDGGGTGAVVILAAGGGHNSLNVGTESSDFVPFFFNYGVSTVILRNRLKKDGYDPKTDEVYDAQQAIRMVRAHAKEWKIDSNKIGIIGFSAGAELASAAAVYYEKFDAENSDPSDPLAGVSSRPDFVGIVYPGPSPFAVRGGPVGGPPAIPKDVPPAFITCGGSGDAGHAVWADEYFAAMLAARVPNIEMHIYGNGRHPGDRMAGGLNDRGGIPYGAWQFRFVDWFRDLGFLGKSGEETRAAVDVAGYVKNPPRRAGATTSPTTGRSSTGPAVR